jgi:phosphoglycolate phosphatase-like HAD superfamily hydrolase
MRLSPSHQVITKDKFGAVLFDLDGVLTDTAKIHAACWKKMFDDFLQKLAQERGEEPFQPFKIFKNDVVTECPINGDAD